MASSTSLDALSIALVKRLAHPTDGAIRGKAVSALRKWLQSRADISHTQMMKIWRGLFYCFWMSDKVPVQQQLAAALADLMLAPLPFDRALLLLSTCLTTLQREWTSIDQLRMDKFMTLVRRFVHRGFLVLAAGRWNAEQVEALTTLYLEPEGLAPLSPDTVARGFFLHVTDTFLPELERAAAESPASPLSFDALNTLLTPFYHVLALTKDQSMVERVRKEVFDPIVELCRPMKQTTAAAPAAAASNGKRKQQKDSDEDAEDMSDDEDEEEEEEPQQQEEDAGLAADFPVLHSVLQGHAPSLAAILFQLASDADITEKSRKLLYSYSAQLQQAAQQGEEDEDAEAEAEADAAAAAIIAAQKKSGAKAARKAAAATATAAAALSGKKRKSTDDDEEDADSSEQQLLEPGVGSEGLAKVSAALSKKKNKKQRLAAKRRKTEALLGTEAGAVDGKHAAAAAAASTASSKKQKQQQQRQNGSALDSDDEDEDGAAFDDEDDEEAMLDLDSDEERELEDEEQASASSSFDEAEEEDDSAAAIQSPPKPKMSKKEAARLEAALAAAQAKKKNKQPKKIQPTLVQQEEEAEEMEDEEPQQQQQTKSKKQPQHQPQQQPQQQQAAKSKKPAAVPAASSAAASAAAAATSSAVAAAAASLFTPPKPSAKQARAGPTIIPDPSIAAPAPAAFLTPQPAKKLSSPSKHQAAGTAMKSSLASAAAPPSSSKKNVSIVLANNDVRLFKRFARDSMSVSTSELLAKPSPKSAIKPESIQFFLAHNKNGRELAAQRRQQALASEMNAAAPQTPSNHTGRTPPVSPRAKAADFFFQ